MGDIYPIGDSIGFVNIGGLDWELYDGFNGDMHVYSFIAPQPVNKIDTDVKLFFDHLTTNNGFPADSQHLLSRFSAAMKNAPYDADNYSLASRH